jgi:biopolymer transport protein ExbD
MPRMRWLVVTMLVAAGCSKSADDRERPTSAPESEQRALEIHRDTVTWRGREIVRIAELRELFAHERGPVVVRALDVVPMKTVNRVITVAREANVELAFASQDGASRVGRGKHPGRTLRIHHKSLELDSVEIQWLGDVQDWDQLLVEMRKSPEAIAIAADDDVDYAELLRAIDVVTLTHIDWTAITSPM